MKRTLCLGLVACLAACSGSGDDGDDNTNPPICLNVQGSETVAGLEIRRPEANYAGCRGIDGSREDERICEEKVPDLDSCFGQAPDPGVDRTPRTVTLTGCVASFGLEAQSDDLLVTVLEELTGQRTDPGYNYDGTPAMGVGAEKTPTAFLGQAVSTSVPASQCTDEGAFSISGVKTETPLIIRVTDQHLAVAERQYVDTYQYNVILRNDVLRSGPTPADPIVAPETCTSTAAECYVVDDVNTVFETTFTTIALTAGVSNIDGDDDLYDGSGQGHVAGEVQDCTSDDTIKNAVVSLSNKAKKLAYFNVDFPPAVANLEDPKVDQSRTRTNADGLYAAIAVDAMDGGQEVTIGAAITKDVCGADGECACNADGSKNLNDSGDGADVQVLGSRQVFVYPDSITILTFDEVMYRAQ